MRTVTRQEFQAAIEAGIKADADRAGAARLTPPQVASLRNLGATAKTTGWKTSYAPRETAFACPLHQARIGLVSYDFFSNYDAMMDSVLGSMPSQVKIRKRLPLREKWARFQNKRNGGNYA